MTQINKKIIIITIVPCININDFIRFHVRRSSQVPVRPSCPHPCARCRTVIRARPVCQALACRRNSRIVYGCFVASLTSTIREAIAARDSFPWDHRLYVTDSRIRLMFFLSFSTIKKIYINNHIVNLRSWNRDLDFEMTEEQGQGQIQGQHWKAKGKS